MRIISGYLKGRKIIQPKDKLTRPLKDLTKESIFNIIKHSKLINFDLKKSKILDLFSGVGSFGLECVSRGAKNVTFCENYPESIKVLKRNILNFECQNKTEVIMENIFNIKNFTQFYNKEFDILLCTTIIESGIDNPNVNTIIVDDADNFGLSQLYQLRGRIGRGVNQGYAYLFHK